MRQDDNKLKQVTVTNLAFYFDGLQRDRFDQGALNRRVGTWLGVREQLLRLPEEVYEVTMAAIQSLVAVGVTQAAGGPGAAGAGGNRGANPHRQAAVRLYESTRDNLTASPRSEQDLPTSAV